MTSFLLSQRYDGWSLDDRDPAMIQSLMPFYRWVYDYYFCVQSDGWQHIPDQENVLYVGSHNGGLAAPDMHMFVYEWYRRFGCDRPFYGLMHSKVWDINPPLAAMGTRVGAIRAHPKMAIAALRRHASLLVYPGGAKDAFRPHRLRDRIYFTGAKGFVKLALREHVPIVPVISWGAHDTLIVLDDVYDQTRQLNLWGMPWMFMLDPEVFPIYLGLPWGVAIGPLPNIPWPVQIHIRVCPAIKFERYGRETLTDKKYVNECYNKVVNEMQSALNTLIAECS